jgi:hypothetical protein
MSDNITFTGWRPSSHSFSLGNCVEVGSTPGVVGVRDTKDREGPVLTFSGQTWGRWIGRLKASRCTFPSPER